MKTKKMEFSTKISRAIWYDRYERQNLTNLKSFWSRQYLIRQPFTTSIFSALYMHKAPLEVYDKTLNFN